MDVWLYLANNLVDTHAKSNDPLFTSVQSDILFKLTKIELRE